MNKAVLVLFFIFITTLNAFALDIEPGELSSFIVTVSKPVTAGAEFGLKIEAKDAFGNTITNYNKIGRALLITTTGSGKINPDFLEPDKFINGAAIINCVYDKAETIRVIIKEETENITSSSALFSVSSGKLSSFKTEFPQTARAGDEFEFSIIAVDKFGNVINDFNKQSNGVVINSTGAGRLSPQMISPDKFTKGKAVIKAYYDAAEVVRFDISDQKNTVKVISNPVSVSPGDLVEFVLTAPRLVSAGRKFSASIEARDRFGNIVVNYERTGGGAELSTNGSGELTPLYVAASNFDNGVAFISFSYTVAETIRIFAQERGAQVFGQSGNIKVSSGEYSKFTVHIPARVTAAENFEVSVRAVDEYNNTVKDYNIKGKDVFVRVIGSIRMPAEKIPAAEFIEGAARINLSYETAEDVFVEVYSEDGSVRASSLKFRVGPASAENFKIQVPEKSVAGEAVTVTLTAVDRFGNLVENYNETGQDIVLAIEGSGPSPSVNIEATRFSRGVARAAMVYEKAEKVAVTAKTRDSQISVKSRIIEITPAYLDRFDVIAPEQIEAGEPFILKVTAFDKFGNILTHYNLTGKGVKLHSNGAGTVIPAVINPSQFNTGTAQIEAYYYSSEIINITAVERQSIEIGTSSLMKITPGVPSHFVVYSPPKAAAGAPFTLKIEAQDKYFNTVRDYSRIGDDLQLAVSGRGRVIPETVAAADFKSGIAALSLIYDRAEEIRVMAKTQKGLEGLSKNIYIEPSAFEKFDVDAVLPIKAGEPFKARITAKDAYGNLIKENAKLPGGAKIFTTGTGSIAPSTVSPKAFENGIAQMDFIYDKAESIKISANLVSIPADYLTIEDVIYKTAGNKFEIMLIANAPMTYKDVKIVQPRLLIADIPAANLTVKQRRVEFEDENISAIIVTQETLEPMPVVRLSVALKEYVPYTADLKGNILRIVFQKEQTRIRTEKIELKRIEPEERERIEFKEPPPVSDDEAEFIIKAKRLIRIEQYEAAMDNIKEALRINPDNREARAIEERLKRILELIR